MNEQTHFSSDSPRRKIIPIFQFVRASQVVMQKSQLLHYEESKLDTEYELKPNSFNASRRRSPVQRMTQSMGWIEKSNLIRSSSASVKPLLVPSKHNINYMDLFDKKIIEKRSSFRIQPKKSSNKMKQAILSRENSQKIVASVLTETREVNIILPDLLDQTKKMLKGMKQSDLSVFKMMIDLTERIRFKEAQARWKHFSLRNFPSEVLDDSNSP